MTPVARPQSSAASRALPGHERRLAALETRLTLCKWAAALSLGIGAGAWAFASQRAEGGSLSLAVFSVAVLVCLLATGAGSLLESQRERLQGVGPE